MSLVERYIFRVAGTAFVACLFALTAVIWLTQALRELNLVTGKGQTILIFLQVTVYGLPALVTIVAPIALFIAVLYALNRLNGDSELIVISAAGISPRLVLRPLLVLTLLVSLMTALMSIHLMPESFRALRTLITKIRADVVTRILQEGRFVNLDQGIVFHFREKQPGGAMAGVMIHDSRDPKLTAAYLAERGQLVEVEGRTYLVLDKGSMQRQDPNQRDSTIIAFDRYVFDLDQFEQQGGKINYRPRERRTSELMFGLDRSDAYVASQAGRFRAELHDRFASSLYPLATLAIAFAALGVARTTRQGRGGAIFGAVAALIVMRIAGFAATSFAVRSEIGAALMYAIPLAAMLLGAYAARRNLWPRPASRRLGLDAEAMARLFQRVLAFRRQAPS